MVIEITPVPKPRMVGSDRWKKRPSVLRYWAFKDKLRSLVEGTLEPSFDVTFVFPMPQTWSNKKKAANDGKPHQQRPDLDNAVKALMDALCDEDSHIHDVHMRKTWGKVGQIILREHPKRLV